MRPKQKFWILGGIRIVLGILLLLSGIGKLLDNSDAIYLVELMATEFYALIEYAGPIVVGLSLLEVIIGTLLLLNRYVRQALIIAATLFLFFIAVLGYFYLQGINVQSCGCFGAFGMGSGIESTLVRNVLLVIIAGAGLFLLSRTPSDSGSGRAEAEPVQPTGQPSRDSTNR